MVSDHGRQGVSDHGCGCQGGGVYGFGNVGVQ